MRFSIQAQVTVVPATLDDWRAVAVLFGTDVLRPSRAHFLRTVGGVVGGWWLARRGECVVGAGQLLRHGSTWEIASLFVDPAVRRQGVATVLLQEMQDAAAAAGAPAVELLVDCEQGALLPLYERAGFTVAARRVLPAGHTALLLRAATAPQAR